MRGISPPAQLPSNYNPDQTQDVIYETLKNARRREVLRYLLFEENPAQFTDVVRYVASRENDTSPRAVSTDQRNRVRTALYQHHLDKLQTNGFIDYDKRAGVIQLKDEAKPLTNYLDPQADTRERTVEYAFGVLFLTLGVLLVVFGQWSASIAVAIVVSGGALLAYEYQRSRSH